MTYYTVTHVTPCRASVDVPPGPSVLSMPPHSSLRRLLTVRHPSVRSFEASIMGSVPAFLSEIIQYGGWFMS
jgi:hypothetical protein